MTYLKWITRMARQERVEFDTNTTDTARRRQLAVQSMRCPALSAPARRLVLQHRNPSQSTVILNFLAGI